MRVARAWLRRGCALALLASLASCGGGGGGGSSAPPEPPVLAANQMLITIEQNPAVSVARTVNVPYVTLKVCDATGQCADIDHVVLDTGSYGLRLLQSAVTAAGLKLPADTDSSGNRYGECVKFLSGYMWGSVSHATLQLGAGTTTPLPLQVAGASDVAQLKDQCSVMGGVDAGTASVLQANGLLGIGAFNHDLGSYYSCPANATTCTALTSVPVAEQVVNPVPLITNSSYTNGIILQLPAVPETGAGRTYGTLTFGVDTEANNAISNFAPIPLDSKGFLTVAVDGSSYSASFLDSGSNYYFAPPLAGTVATDAQGNFIPPSLLSLPLSLSANTAGASSSVAAQMLLWNYASMNFALYSAFNDIGSATDLGLSGIDLGLPFFYGRQVAYVISGHSSSLGPGPLVALH